MNWRLLSRPLLHPADRTFGGGSLPDGLQSVLYELLDLHSGHVVIAGCVDMHDTSLAEESPVEGACDLLEFGGETAIRSSGEGVDMTRGVERPLLAGPVVADAFVAMNAAALQGVWRVDVRGYGAPEVGVSLVGPKRTRLRTIVVVWLVG